MRWGLALLALAWGSTFAAADWSIEPIARQAFIEVAPHPSDRDQGPVANGLPDGSIARVDSGDVRRAWYESPTTRYGHGVIGDRIEAGALVVTLSNGETLRFDLPDTEVFEDRTPRIADLDGDGTNEVITIHASVHAGAAVTVFGVMENQLHAKGTTGFIGTPNRWLNIAGIARFSGTAAQEIAYVRTPHIGGTLILVRFDQHGLTETARLAGFSNHAIGSRKLGLSAHGDFRRDGTVVLALPSGSRRALKLVRVSNGVWEVLDEIRLPDRIDTAIHVEQDVDGTVFRFGLANGAFLQVKWAEDS